MLDWNQIDTVLLDMDGTLLDLHFDNHFWLQHVPKRYAEKNNLTQQQAVDELLQRYRLLEGTIDWYCIDYWSKELDLDILLLKEEVKHLIKVHPYVLEFLEFLHTSGKRRVLVTNAHQKSLNLKMQNTPLAGHLDKIISAHQLGLPKEESAFWNKLQAVEDFNVDRTLLIDDNLGVLRSARTYGIKHLLAIYRPDSRAGVKNVDDFQAIYSFKEIVLKSGFSAPPAPPG